MKPYTKPTTLIIAADSEPILAGSISGPYRRMDINSLYSNQPAMSKRYGWLENDDDLEDEWWEE